MRVTVAVAVVSVLTACGGDDSDGGQASEASAPPAAEEPTPEPASFADAARALPGANLSDDDTAIEDLADIICRYYEDLPINQAGVLAVNTLTDVGLFPDEDTASGFVELTQERHCP